jgi:hypothetical protein
MKKSIVMTSINPPTEAVFKYAEMTDWDIVMVGDKKTPTPWECENIKYLSPEDQIKLPYTLSKILPWNLPARANIGYLYAMEAGHEFITQSDDDNIPNEHWGVPAFSGTFKTIEHPGFINIYKYFTDKFVWPRGFPLDKILTPTDVKEKDAQHKVGVWQHLADEDTDVDAIYRLINNNFIYFNQREPLVLSKGTKCPFNCQSTTYHKDVYPLLYLPAYITPRASDIVRGLITQPILWHHGYVHGFTAPIVTQKRNPHNYLRDFKDEILIYLHSEDILSTAEQALKKGVSISDNLHNAYKALIEKKLIPAEELPMLEAWLSDVSTFTKH